jgi:putative DNA primase/helicase
MFDPLDPVGAVQPDAADPVAEEEKFEPMIPLAGLEKEEIHHFKLGKPSRIWPYRHVTGLLDGYVCQFETVRPDGTPGKEFRPFRYGSLVKNGQTKVGWHWKGWDKGRPLYGLAQLRARADAPIFVRESEKKADAAKRLFPIYVAVSPMNGAQSPHKSDWAPVAGHDVVIWPDHDEPGRKFAKAAASRTARFCGPA